MNKNQLLFFSRASCYRGNFKQLLTCNFKSQIFITLISQCNYIFNIRIKQHLITDYFIILLFVINLSYYNQRMGSPKKDRYKQGLQHQILTNYYLSKFDRYMSRLNEKKVQTTFPERSLFTLGRSNPKRKNFKHVILEKKGVRVSKDPNEQNRKKSQRKNFREELQHKHVEEKVKKQNKKNFHLLEDSIVNELYKPSPSPLQNGNFKEIQIQHKITHLKKGEKAEKIQPFKLYQNQQQDNIQINEYYESQIYQENEDEQNYQVISEKIQHQRISIAIKETFQKRSPSRKQSSSKKLSRSQSQQKSDVLYQSSMNSFKSPERGQQERFSIEKKLPKERENPPQPPQPLFEKNESSQLYPKFGNTLEPENNYEKQRKNSITSRQNSVSRQKSRKNSGVYGQKNFNSSISSRKNSINESNKQRMRRQSFYNEQYSLGPTLLEIHEQQNRQKMNLSSYDENNASFRSKSSRFKHSSQNIDRDSIHEVSIASQFSMSSEQANYIKQSLEKELNQHQFGPYQSALTNLLQLLEGFPKAWPIFMVSQRILQDRQQYEQRRQAQQNQMSKFQLSIQNLQREQKKRRTQSEINRINILKLVRELSTLLTEETK